MKKKILITLIAIVKIAFCPSERLVKEIKIEEKSFYLLESQGLFLPEKFFIKLNCPDLLSNEKVLTKELKRVLLSKIDKQEYHKRLDLALSQKAIDQDELKKYKTNLDTFKVFLVEENSRSEILEKENLAWQDIETSNKDQLKEVTLQEHKNKLDQTERENLILKENAERLSIASSQNEERTNQWLKNIVLPSSNDPNPADNKTYSEVDTQTDFDVKTMISTNTSSFEVVDTDSTKSARQKDEEEMNLITLRLNQWTNENSNRKSIKSFDALVESLKKYASSRSSSRSSQLPH